MSKKSIKNLLPSENQSTKNLAKELSHNGVAVITKTWLKDKIKIYNQEWHDTLSKMPEYKRFPDKFVQGGFQALGNPSSFHNHLVRKIRQWCMSDVIPILSQYKKLNNLKGFNAEQYVDRMLYRPPRTKITAESWHRDVSPSTDPQDIIFGGWINFNDVNQHFSCVIKSHIIKQNKSGFVKLTDEEKKEFKDSPDRRIVVIPPGSIIIFNEKIVHEVLATSKDYHVKRLFLGWGLTKRKVPFFTEFSKPHTKEKLKFDDFFKLQRPIPLKSGQYPPMYNSNHWIYKKNRDNLVEWSKRTFIEKLLITRIVNKGKKNEETVIVIEQYMSGLLEYDLTPYNKYSDDELNIYKPGKKWNVLVPGEDKKKYTLEL